MHAARLVADREDDLIAAGEGCISRFDEKTSFRIHRASLDPRRNDRGRIGRRLDRARDNLGHAGAVHLQRDGRREAARFSVLACKGARSCSANVAHNNRAVIFGDALDLADFAQHPSGKAALFVGIGHRDGEGIGQAAHKLAHHRGDADMRVHPVNRIRIALHLTRCRESVHLHEAATLVLIELLRV